MGKISRAMKIQMKKYCRENKAYIFDMAEQSMFGEELECVCVYCREGVQGYESDIRYAHCENCEKYGVFSFEELMFSIPVDGSVL